VAGWLAGWLTAGGWLWRIYALQGRWLGVLASLGATSSSGGRYAARSSCAVDGFTFCLDGFK
jgi:hypothetical protein